MKFNKKNLCILFNLIYLSILQKTSRSTLKFSFPRIDAGLNINIQDCGILEIDNLSARRNLNIFVSKGRLSFDKGCFVNNNCSFNCLELIEVGRNSIFGEGVKIYDHDHLITDGYCVHKDEFLTAPIKIGENCWIGSNTIILKGVIIANNVIIGANSLVNKSILEPGVYVNKNSKLIKIK